MAVDGVGGEQPINNRYTMESLNIQQGTYKASIFQKIDASDGSNDGFLTEDQYQRYSEIDTPLKALVKLIKSPFENIKKAKEAKEKAQVSPEAEQAYRELGGTGSIALDSANGLKNLKK